MSIDVEGREGPADSDLKVRLRAAAAYYPQRGVPGGAWQEQERRTAAARRSRRNWWVRSSVAACLALLIGGLWVDGRFGDVNDRQLRGVPGGDPFTAASRLAPPMTLERLTLSGVPTRHEAVLTDVDGKGVSLCDRYVSGGGSAGGCTSRDDNADQPFMAFDWLSGTSGAGNLRGVVAGVDQRVDRVDIWMTNGDRMLATLKTTGDARNDRLFALTVTAAQPRPQRLVAYAADGHVLQAVDLAGRFVGSWLRTVSPCTNSKASTPGWVQSPPPSGAGAGAGVTIRWGSRSASVAGGRNPDPSCVSLRTTALAGWTMRAPDTLVVLVSPETVLVRFSDPAGTVAELKVAPGDGSPYGDVVFRGLSQAVLKDAQVQALDVTGQVLDRGSVAPTP